MNNKVIFISMVSVLWIQLHSNERSKNYTISFANWGLVLIVKEILENIHEINYLSKPVLHEVTVYPAIHQP